MGFIRKFPMSLFILGFLVIELVSERDFTIYLDYGHCTHNPVYVISSNCSVDESFDPPRSYFDVQLQREIQSLFFKVQITLKNKKKVRKFVNSKSENLCDFMEGKPLAFLFDIARNALKKYGKFPERCPVQKDFHFLFKDMFVDPEYFPVFTPRGNFSMVVTINCGKEFCLKYEYRGSIKQK